MNNRQFCRETIGVVMMTGLLLAGCGTMAVPTQAPAQQAAIEAAPAPAVSTNNIPKPTKSSVNGTHSGMEYYVAKSGSDSNDGSEARPWLTIQQAANSVQPGDTVYIKEGIYSESVELSVSGQEERNITFTHFENDRVEITAKSCNGINVDADYITIDGLIIRDAYYREDGNCPDWTASGITTHRSHNIFRNNEISNSMYGIMLRANIGDEDGVIWPTEGSNIIRGNYIHDTDYAAVRVKRSNNNVVENNKFHRNHMKQGSFNDKDGNILFYTEAPLVFYCLENLRIVNNEFVEPRYGPVILELDMVTRTGQAPSMAPNPDKTQCPLTLNGVVIEGNTAYKTKNTKYPIILTLGRDFALGKNHVMDNNIWFNGRPGSKIIEWGYNFWHDNDSDDGIGSRVWTLKEFQGNTGFDANSTDARNP